MENILSLVTQLASNGSGYLLCVVLLSLCGPHWMAASLSTPAHPQSAFMVIHPSPTLTPDFGTTTVTLTSEGQGVQDSADISRLSPSTTSTLSIFLNYFTTSLIPSHGLVTNNVLGTEFVSIMSSISHQWESNPTSVHASSTIVTSASVTKLHILNATKSYASVFSISTFPSNNTKKTTFTNVSDGSNTATGFGNHGNGSCSGNNTGCPEYNGRHVMSLTTTEIIGIAVGAAVIVIIVVCLLLFMCRHRQTLSGSKADLSAYWEDNVTLSYINGHLDYPKDVSDEMISLDNDSFLNSLDSISFTNLWATEHAKHTNL